MLPRRRKRKRLFIHPPILVVHALFGRQKKQRQHCKPIACGACNSGDACNGDARVEARSPAPPANGGAEAGARKEQNNREAPANSPVKSMQPRGGQRSGALFCGRLIFQKTPARLRNPPLRLFERAGDG